MSFATEAALELAEELAFNVRELREQLLGIVADEAYEILKRNTPRRTGQLFNSIEFNIGDNYLHIDVTHPKAAPIELGSRPSKGTYVPKLGRRIKRGRHPGTAPKLFVEKSFRELSSRIDDIVVDLLERTFG